MSATVAIHPDDYTAPGSKWEDASSPRWAAALEAAGYSVKWVDVTQNDIIQQLEGCVGLMWRWNHSAAMYRVARRVLPVVERTLGLSIYPDQDTCWHYDDKISQHYLLPALEIPTPNTWVFFDRKEADDWAESSDYPVVMKLATGAGSENVRLLRSAAEAHWWISQMFNFGRVSLEKKSEWKHFFKSIPRRILRGRYKTLNMLETEIQIGYAYFQEFLPGNAYDTRITVIGDRAFGFRRFNRPNDFRASGSGSLDTNVTEIPLSSIAFCFEAAAKLKAQSIAFDLLMRDGKPVVGEISYTYVSGAVHACPGHWVQTRDAGGPAIDWHDGPMWPEEAQIEDFIERLRSRPVVGS